MYLEESSMRRWKGWDVLAERFYLGHTLRESSMNRWKGWDVLGGNFDDKMERLGCA